jgi:hypothetical protein
LSEKYGVHNASWVATAVTGGDGCKWRWQTGAYRD